MTRRFSFKPTLRQTLTANAAYLGAMSPGGKLPEDLQKSLDHIMPKARKSIVNRSAPETLETPILGEIADMLRDHPLVAIAIRANSGSASYEAKSGKWAPVKFYDWIKRPEKMRLVDVWGILTTGRFYALEVKRSNWTKPSDDREYEQAAFLRQVRYLGGLAGFVTSVDQAKLIIES